MSLALNEVVCGFCGKMVKRAPSKISRSKNHFCSHSCYSESKVGSKRSKHSEVMKQYWKIHKHPMLGKKHSVESRLKMSNSWIYSKKITKERNDKISESLKGDKNYNWKGGPKTTRDIKNYIRKQREYVNWRTAVFERDDFTCQSCETRSKKGKTVELEAHHIKSFANFPKLRYEVSNGLTLCLECHREVHYGSQ